MCRTLHYIETNRDIYPIYPHARCSPAEFRGTGKTPGSRSCPSRVLSLFLPLGIFIPVRSDIDDLDIGDRAVCRLVLLTVTTVVEHIDAYGVVGVVCRDVLVRDVFHMAVLCTCVCLDPEGAIRAVHDDVSESDVLDTSIRMHGPDGQAMSMADVGVLHQQVVSVRCHVIVAQVNMAVVDVGWRAIDIDPVCVMRRLSTV